MLTFKCLSVRHKRRFVWRVFLKKERTVESLIRKGLEESGFRENEESMIRDLSFYAIELERWNRKMNLTGKQTGESIVSDLLYDALFIFPHIRNKQSVLDMGSGAGILGICFAVLERRLHVVSVDASTKKIQFQRHVKRALGLENIRLYASRIENLEPQAVEAIVAKAFGSTHDVLCKAARHLSADGEIFLVKGKSEPEREFPGFALEGAVRYSLSGSAKEFKLITYKKVR